MGSYKLQQLYQHVENYYSVLVMGSYVLDKDNNRFWSKGLSVNCDSITNSKTIYENKFNLWIFNVVIWKR